jgi:DNA ligase-1
VYNEKTSMFESFCKLGSGFSDADLASLPKLLTVAKMKQQPNNVLVTKQMIPDVWIAPTKVVEVLAAQITKSPFHMAGRKPGSTTGLALHFPRFIRWRDDKKPEQATTTKEVLRMALSGR